mgnify:CR=1 FL=1
MGSDEPPARSKPLGTADVWNKALMNEPRRGLLTSAVVVLLLGSAVLGMNVRDQVDLGLARHFNRPQIDDAALASTDPVAAIGIAEYFARLVELLENEYVEPITDEMALAAGGVRGMVMSLDDPHSIFYDPEAFPVFIRQMGGSYEGIGADLVFIQDRPPSTAANGGGERSRDDTSPSGPETDQVAPGVTSSRIPRVAVGAVVPGGPADRAGIKPGDWVESIDGRWVVNSKFVDEAREIQLKVTRKELPTSALDELRREIRNRARNSLSPMRAKEKLTRGTSGSLKVVFNRGDDKVEVSVLLAKSEMPPIEQSRDGSIRLRLVPGVAGKLSEMIRGRSEVTLDLRGNAVGDYRSMLEILAVLAPTGEYGALARTGRNPLPIKVESGNERAPKIRLVVDKTTRGTAEVLAHALKAGGRASLDPSATAGEPFATEIHQLPNGSGYTLAIGRFAGLEEVRS